MAVNKKTTETLSIRLTPAQKIMIENESRKTGKSMNAIIRESLEDKFYQSVNDDKTTITALTKILNQIALLKEETGIVGEMTSAAITLLFTLFGDIPEEKRRKNIEEAEGKKEIMFENMARELAQRPSAIKNLLIAIQAEIEKKGEGEKSENEWE